MASPTYGAAGTYLTGTSAANAVIAVPAGVAADHIVVCFVYKENAATVTGLPAGFAEAADSPVIVSGTQLHNLHVFWKRATGADSGTYTFSWTGSTYREAVAARYVGAITTGNPIDVTNSAARTTTNANGTPAVSDTTTVAETLLIWAATNWNGGAWTPPTSFTERVDTGADISMATLAQAAAGATGSLTGSCVNDASSAAWLGALKPPGSGSQTVVAPLVTSSTTIFNPTVVPGSVTVVVPILETTSTIFSPGIIQKIDLSLIAVTSTVFSPTVVPGSVTIAVPLLETSTTVFSPILYQTVVTSLLQTSSEIFSPEVIPGEITVEVPLLATTSTVFSPLVADENISVLLINVSSTIFDPTVVQMLQIIDMLLIETMSSIFNPLVSGGGVSALANTSIADRARANMLVNRSRTEPDPYTNTDLMRLVLEDAGQILVTETDASAATHLMRYMMDLRD